MKKKMKPTSLFALNILSTAGFSNLITTDSLNCTIPCCAKLSCTSWDLQQRPWPQRIRCQQQPLSLCPNNKKCLQNLPHVPLGSKSSVAEKHYSRVMSDFATDCFLFWLNFVEHTTFFSLIHIICCFNAWWLQLTWQSFFTEVQLSLEHTIL